MYVCMYVGMYVCMYVFYECTHVCKNSFTKVYMEECMYVRICMYLCILIADTSGDSMVWYREIILTIFKNNYW